MKMIDKYDKQSLFSIERELGCAASSVKWILKDRAHIEEHVNSLAPLKSTLLIKKCSGATPEMEKLLTM